MGCAHGLALMPSDQVRWHNEKKITIIIITSLDFAAKIQAANTFRKEEKLSPWKENTLAGASSFWLLGKHPGLRGQARQAHKHACKRRLVRLRRGAAEPSPVPTCRAGPDRAAFSQVPRGKYFALRLPLKA